MKKHVYKITNLINSKVYVGQTNNLERRIHEHKHDKRKNRPITRAIEKYGFDNFRVDILYCGEDYNYEEKKWIKRLNSTDRNYGYNIRDGGQDSSGENNPSAVINQGKANTIIDMLLNTSMTCGQIADKEEVSVYIVYHINHGEAWADSDLEYPLKKEEGISEHLIKETIKLLTSTEKSYQEIANIVGIYRHYVDHINNGKIYMDSDLKYPIRARFIGESKIAYIKTLLKTTDLYFKDIAKITDTSISIVSNINNGRTWRVDGETYPIRSKQYV